MPVSRQSKEQAKYNFIVSDFCVMAQIALKSQSKTMIDIFSHFPGGRGAAVRREKTEERTLSLCFFQNER